MKPLLLLSVLCLISLGSLSAENLTSLNTVSVNKVPLGINLAGVVDWSTEYPFVDLFRTARGWVSQQEGQPWGKGPELKLTPEGWVASLEPGQYATTLMMTHGGHLPGKYVCLYEGEGQLDFQGNGKAVSSTSGRIEVEVGTGSTLMLHLRKTNPNNPVRNIRFLMPGTENTYEKEPFYEGFLQRTGQFQVIRFMDWMNTNNSKIVTWEDRPRPSDATQTRKGVCLEWMIALCNKLRVHPWFCMPHLADDGYVRAFAMQVQRDLDPELRVYVEYSNEVWNGQFEQARYAQKQGKALNLATNDYQAQLFYHSLRSVQIFRIWEEVFGSKDRLVRVLGSQSANPWVSEQVMNFWDAWKHADAIAIAPYFGGELGNPKKAEEVAQLTLEQVFERCEASIRENEKKTREQVQKAKARNLVVIAYEGGQHLVGHGGAENNERLMQLFHEANRHPRMKDLYLKDLQSWQDAGGGLFAVFSSVGQPSKWGSWGILESEHQKQEQAPKYQAILEYLKR